jgi:large subunit ribosomal protein L11
LFGRPGHEVLGKLHVKQIYEIAKVKQRDDHMKNFPLETISRMIIGSANTMGIEIVSG